MSVPQITVDLTPPSIGQSVEEFNAQAHIWTANLSDGFKPQANALATFVNQKAVDANDDATAAQTARTQAQTASGTASTAATTATTAANNAGISATTASTKAGEASTAATTASTKAGEASASASAALASKNAAATSESNAAGSASTASTKAGEASTSATTASTKAGEASTSATLANTKAGEASASASAALASKNAAATSETNAAGSASAAALSQAAAYQSKLDAEAAAEQAAGGGEPTILPGTSAQYWRGDKTWQTLDKSAVGLSNVDNVSAANLRDRATHTGTQAISTVSGLQTELDGKAAVGSTAGANLGTASAGSAATAARSDHVHKLPTAAEVGAAPASHASATDNPHSVTKAQVGLSNVDNVSEANLRDRATHTGTQAQSTVTNLTTDLAALKSIPGNTKSAAYTLVMADAGMSIDTTSNVTIPANSSVAFPIGTTVMVTNTSATNSTISINTDTLRQAGTTNTGSRTLAGYGIATLRKVNSTTWFISGAGLS